jgi:hypothetical protein
MKFTLTGSRSIRDNQSTMSIAINQSIANQNERVYCQYTDTAIGFGIVFAIVGAILMVGGFVSKEQEEQTTY